MNDHAELTHILKKITIKYKKGKKYTQQVIVCTMILGENVKLGIWHYEKEMFSKRAITYELSWLSTEMNKVMSISIAYYLMIIYSYSAHMCILQKKCAKRSFQIGCINNIFFYFLVPIFFCKATTKNIRKMTPL